MNIINVLLNKIIGLDAAAIKAEEDERAYKRLRRLYCLMFLSLLIAMPGAVYTFMTVYLPVLGKSW